MSIAATPELELEQLADSSRAVQHQQMSRDIIHQHFPASFSSENHEREPERQRVLVILFK